MARTKSDCLAPSPALYARNVTFVTNNAVDFLRQFRHEAIHPGLVILIPDTTHSVERAPFLGALDFIGDRYLVNRVIEIDPRGATSVIRETSWGTSASFRIADQPAVPTLWPGQLLVWPFAVIPLHTDTRHETPA
jgi:hypothetical protein